MPDVIAVSQVRAPAAPRASLRLRFDSLRPVERWCYLVGAALIAVGLLHVVPALIYPRPWLGPLSWRKPITFGLSFGTILISITWLAGYLRLSDRARTVILGVFAVDCILEVGGISIQAWRHVPSHFNTETPFDMTVAMNLAFGGAVLIATLGTLCVVAVRGRIDAEPGMRLALRVGFGLLLAGLAAGVAMIARGEVLINTSTRATAYDTAGFLKWFHGITLHAVLVLAVLARLLSHVGTSEPTRVRVVGIVAGIYVAAAVLTLVVSIALV